MYNVQPSKRFKIISLGLLVLLNVVLRLPSIPHAKGRDAFFIQSLASSLNAFGAARWWDHWLSVFGYFPYSYASGLPFTLSGMSQLLGINLENSILIYSIIFGTISLFFAFVLAGLIYNNFLFKYAMAFFFSISPGIMIFTTWEASARGPFMIFLPLLLFVLLKSVPSFKKYSLSVLILIFLFSIHHYAIFTAVLTGVYIFLNIVFNINLKHNIFKSLKKHSLKLNYLYLIIIFGSFMYPFVTHTMITAGSRYAWIISLIITNVRFIGLAAFLAIGGIISLALSSKKNFPQWYFLISFIFMVPFIYDLTYGMYLLLLYSIVFLSYGFKRSLDSHTAMDKRSLKVVSVFLAGLIIISTIFTGFYNHTRTGEYKSYWYMDEKTYEFSNWVDNEIGKDNRIFMNSENNYYIRAVALQENQLSILIGGAQGRAYGFINDSYTNFLDRVPMTSSYFYSEGAYTTEERDIYRSMEWYVTNKDISTIKSVYSADYLIQTTSYYNKIKGSNRNNMQVIYSNGVHEVYDLSIV
jgi:hypothetical protein